jgi:hypothetical protein
VPLERTGDRAEIGQFPESKSAFDRGKEVILMTGQNIFGAEPVDGSAKSFSAVG